MFFAPLRMTGLGFLLVLAAVFVWMTPGHATNRLVLNEALANEPGGTTSLEWVEVLNWPDTGDAISLEGYLLVDGTDTTRFSDPALILPGGFAILARRALGDAGFEAQWGDHSGYWGDHSIESFPLLQADISLRNSGDTLVLVSPAGDTSAILWTRDSGDGISFERIRPNGSDSPASFGPAIDLLGSTPGRGNSLLPLRADLAFDSIHARSSPSPGVYALSVSTFTTNVGFGPVDAVTIEIYDDVVPDADSDSLVFVRSLPMDNIDEGESKALGFTWEHVPPGRHRVIGRIVEDGSALNNTAEAQIAVQFFDPLVIISEYLADPSVGGPDEWIEISNRAEFAINMDGCAIGDSTALSSFPGGAGLMQPREFWVLAENEAAFRSYYPDFNGRLLEVSPWRSLNNTGDRIRLAGPSSEIIDSLSFRGGNGGNQSEERVELSPVLLDERYWSPSDHPDGATPGRANTVTPINLDLALDTIFVIPELPAWGGPLTVSTRAVNVGLQKFSPAFAAILYEDLDPTNPGTYLESVGEYAQSHHDSIEIGERLPFGLTWDNPAPGYHRLYAELAPDDNNANNGLFVSTTVRHTLPLVVITEYLADPMTTGPGEWVELFNTADFPVNMALNKIGDSSSASVISPFAGSIAPGAYWVVCEDAPAFTLFYPDFDGLLLQVTGWRTLGNDGDGIRLHGAAGEIIDSVSYARTYGGNRSAERTNRSPGFSQPDDWTASVDPDGATPGRANSVSDELAGSFEIAVSPNPFYLARGQEAEIAYRLEVGARLTLRIFDRAGRLVRTLADDIPSATGHSLWNGTSDGGGQVEPGPYVLLARSEPAGSERKIVLVVGP